MAVLITGGAGYIGSHAVKYFQDRGEDIIILDNLQTGHREAIKQVDKFYRVDLTNSGNLKHIFKHNNIEAVIHFAAVALVGESMEKPFEYYQNNVYGMLCLLEAMKDHGVDKIIFSSTAAVYGSPDGSPIFEYHRKQPINAYGETKLCMEKMMKWFSKAYGIKYVSLRYFNAAGAHESGTIGEAHNPETHLIPLVLEVPLGKRQFVSIFGDDYLTNDGTCVRDYVHVMDLASAHYLALEYLREGINPSNVFNLGNGNGYSVKEVIETAEQVTGFPIPKVIQARRAGDPAVLVSSSMKAQRELGWNPEFSSLEKIIQDAWNWHKNNPDGYEKRRCPAQILFQMRPTWGLSGFVRW